MARIAAKLMDVDGVRLYHDQALYKEPIGGITPWHADEFYWPLSNDNTVAAWIPLLSIPLEMGSLAFAESSQNVEIGRNFEISHACANLWRFVSLRYRAINRADLPAWRRNLVESPWLSRRARGRFSQGRTRHCE
jgi:Phytanoyl-CoA dioxygenase (PhyH)